MIKPIKSIDNDREFIINKGVNMNMFNVISEDVVIDTIDINDKRLFKGIPMYEGDCYIFINNELEYKVVYSKFNYRNYISINRLEELIEAGYICCIHNNNVLPTNELINRCTNDLFIFTTVYGAIYPKVELELVYN